jgi:hypothetical protein
MRHCAAYQPIFKTGRPWQPQGGKVRFSRRSVGAVLQEFCGDRADWRDACAADSTAVGPGKALPHATAIHTAVSFGQTATARARISDYVALVKAQTGTKLSSEQANPLTTEATNL